MALTLKSSRQIQTDILNAIISRLGLTDVNPGSVLDLLTQAVAQEDFNQYVQMSQIVRLVDLNSISGEDLDNRAFEYGLTRDVASAATGQVTLTRTGYEKVSTTFISAGVLAPSRGDTVLNVNSTAGFDGIGGRVVIGRGLENEETIEIASVTVPGTIINLAAPLANDHTFTEEVTFVPAAAELGGTDIVINAGETVTVPATGTNSAIDFEILNDTTLFAGEAELTNIDVRALEVGSQGNVGSGTISQTTINGITVTNGSSFTTGTDLETDESLRDRIRSHIQSLSRGTREAVLNAIVGLVDPSTSKRVVSANVVLPQSNAESVDVYIDDGFGFEPSFSAQATETVVDNASNGTSRLQLDFAPLVKASIESANAEPFDLSAVITAPEETGLQLTVRVGNRIEVPAGATEQEEVALNQETISVLLSDLEFPATARAEEIVRIINNKATLVEARTSENGTRLVLSAKVDENEDIFVERPSSIPTAEDLNTYVQLTNAEQSTLYLYKNDKLLNKDGNTANVSTPIGGPSTFDFDSVNPSVLAIEVDGKSGNIQNVTFDNTMDTRLTGSTTPSIVATVINEQIAGAIADTVEAGARLRISSKTTSGSDSRIRIGVPGSGTDANLAGPTFNFPTGTSIGSAGDYTLNRQLGTIELAEPLISGDTISAGNPFNRATLRTPIAVNTSTRVNEGVGFRLTFDGSSTTFRDVVFSDDRFSSAYLDDNVNRTNNVEFGFNRTAALAGTLPQLIADYVTKQIYPLGTAVLRTIGSNTFIEIRTNTIASDRVLTSESTNNSNGAIQLANIDDAVGNERSLGIWQGITLSLIENERPHTGFRETTSSRTLPSPGSAIVTTNGYNFSPTDSLILVMDDDQATGTFVLPTSHESRVNAASPTNTVFVAPDLISEFVTQFVDGTNGDSDYNATNPPYDVDLRDYFVAFDGMFEDNLGNLSPFSDAAASPNNLQRNSVALRATGNVEWLPSSEDSVSGTNTTRDAAPANRIERPGDDLSVYYFGTGVGTSPLVLADLTDEAQAGVQVGDVITIVGMQNSVNDGTFLITALAEDGGVPTISLVNSSGVAESGSSGSAIVGLKRKISAYGFNSGTITIDLSDRTWRNAPVSEVATPSTFGDHFSLIVNTIPNLITQLNNNKLTSIASRAEVIAADKGERLQISSLEDGSAGFVEVTGGVANTELDFSTIANRGLQGYNYYTGLLALVHNTIYGDDTDLATFPGVGAAGVNFNVIAPTVTEIILELDVTLQSGVSIASVENEVNSAVTGYINGLGVADDVIVEEIRARTIRINGISDVVITSLTGGDTDATTIANIPIADNEIARIKISDITIG